MVSDLVNHHNIERFHLSKFIGEVVVRPLNQKQAQRCEDAKNRRCRCRCEGIAHGADRGSVFELKFEDPHKVERKEKEDEVKVRP